MSFLGSALAALGVSGDADGNQQGDAVEHGFDPERAADLLDAGDADSQYGDAHDGAPDVDPSRLNGRRAEEGADQRRQQIFQTDAGLADAQFRGENEHRQAPSEGLT